MDTISIRNNRELVDALAAGYAIEQIELAADHDEAAIALARQAGFEEGQRQALESAIVAERRRVVAITDLAGYMKLGDKKKCSREDLDAAINSGAPLETFAMFLLDSGGGGYFPI